MALVSKDSFYGLAAGLKVHRLHLKAAGEDAFILEPTANVRDEFDIWINAAAGNNVGIRGAIAALVLCDESGNRLFTIEDAPRLGALPPAVLQPIFDLGAKLLAVTDKEQKELEGNSDASR